MKQLTLAAVGFERYAKTTRRAAFLAEMERVVPWSALCALIEPFYPKPGNGRPPIGVERMLRLYFLQQWFNLSDLAAAEALYDSSAMRRFVGIDLGCEPVPDETTVCRFRHLLEVHDWGRNCSTRCSGTWRHDFNNLLTAVMAILSSQNYARRTISSSGRWRRAKARS